MNASGLVLVGGGPASHAAATAFRAAGGQGPVTILAGEGRPPYRRPPLSKELLRGEAEPDSLPLAEHQAFYDERAITVRHDRAIALRADDRAVTLAGGEVLRYERCVLATGAVPIRPPIPGADRDGVHVLRTVADAQALRAAAEPGVTVLVLGSGFLGCEAAATLRARGCAVTLVSQEAAPQEQRLGPEVASRLAAWLTADGVEARYATELSAIDGDGSALVARTTDGATLPADVMLLAGGVRPWTDLAADAGLALADGGEVAADAALGTSAPAVLACGDCCRAEHAVAGRPLHVEHWGDALAQGEVAGWAAAGRPAAWDTVPGFWSTIGRRTIKYAVWGDGFDTVRITDHDGVAFTAWYGRDGRTVGVLTHDRDADYEAGRRRIEQGAPLP